MLLFFGNKAMETDSASYRQKFDSTLVKQNCSLMKVSIFGTHFSAKKCQCSVYHTVAWCMPWHTPVPDLRQTALVQAMAWRTFGAKPVIERMLIYAVNKDQLQ